MLALSPPSIAMAESNTIYASYRYVMGDNDTKNDAKRVCFLEAKRRLLEKAGVFLESETELKGFKLTKDEVRAYSAALLQVDVVKDEVEFSGGTQAIVMTVKAEIDPIEVRKNVKRISEDKSLREKVHEQQLQLAEMERKLAEVQKRISSANQEAAVPLRKERNVLFQGIDEIENVKINVKETGRKAIANVEIGMNFDDVKKVAGGQRSIDKCGDMTYWNYGDVWVIFNSGVVACIVPSSYFSSCQTCDGYRLYRHVIK
jgi:hypothetical protein